MEKLLQLIDHGNQAEARKEAERVLSQLNAYEQVFGQYHRQRDEAQAHNVYLVNLIKKAQSSDGRINGKDIEHALQLGGTDILTGLVIQQRIAGINNLMHGLQSVLPYGSTELTRCHIKAGNMIASLYRMQNPNIKEVIIAFDGDVENVKN